MAFKCTSAFGGASCDTNRYLVFAEVREELSQKPDSMGFQQQRQVKNSSLQLWKI